MIKRLIWRLNYWFGRFCATFGVCSRCGGKMNVTRHGQHICPHCGARRMGLFL